MTLTGQFVIRCFFIVAIVIPLSPFLRALDPNEQQEAVKKMQQAISTTNIFDLPSFRMNAKAEIESRGKLVSGTYQLLWNAPESWREEINFPGYREVQVGANGAVWVQRSTDFFPLPIYHLRMALGFGSGAGTDSTYSASFVQLPLTSQDVIKKLHSRKQRGDKQTCVEVENEMKLSFDICISDSTARLVRNSSYEDSDFQPIGTKVFPRSLSFSENGKTLAKLNITELVTPVQFPADAFNPLPGVSPRKGCMNPVPSRAIKRTPPRYPDSARKRFVQGTVYVEAWIGSDGVPRLGQLVGHSDPDLEKSTMEAFAQWRYTPAMCKGGPVDVETILKASYTLSP